MKYNYILISAIVMFASCNNLGSKDINNSKKSATSEDSSSNFFPVTTFIKGEINNIKTGGVTPKYLSIKDGKKDSIWLKMDQLDTLLIAFTSPTIDTANLKNKFVEKRFLDQTVGAFTFTCDPILNLQNDFAYTHWDIYIDEETQKVKRIFLVKKIENNKILQLTWQVGKYCKMTTLNKDKIEKEVTIYWSYS